MARQLRSEKAQVWLKPKEKAVFLLLAEQAGLSFSDWARRAMLKAAAEDGAGKEIAT